MNARTNKKPRITEEHIVDMAQAPNRIEALVTRHGISYYDLAKQMGVTRTTVHAVKNKQRPASKKFLVKLAGAEKRIPAEFASNEWIENMSPTSYLWALQKSVILILGPNWKLELTRILANAEAQKPKTTLNTEKPLEIKK